MALRIIAYDGAVTAGQVAAVLHAFAERSDTPSEAEAWRQSAAQLDQEPRLAEALFALRGF